MRILIAEDDDALAKFVRQGLEGEHYTVDIVADGEQARAAATESEYDIVVLDLNLPKLDGVSVLRHLRLKKPSLPVLVLTQRSRVEDRVQCLDTGADDYLAKPFSFSELSARLRALVRQQPHPVGVGADGWRPEAGSGGTSRGARRTQDRADDKRIFPARIPDAQRWTQGDALNDHRACLEPDLRHHDQCGGRVYQLSTAKDR